MRRRRRVRDEGPPSQDRWLVSYADFITLLFAFFVMMYAVSTVDAKKLSQAAAGLHVAFATEPVTSRDGGLLPGSVAPRVTPGPGAGGIDVIEARLVQRLHALGEARVELARDRRGLIISVREAGSFGTGSADLDAASQELFGRIGASLEDIPNAIRVEGHTDDVPIHTGRFASNWELSTARATKVVSFFIEQIGLRPERLSAAGYAEFHPREANDTTEHRARNRRVDIVVLNAHTAVEEEPLVGDAGVR